LKRVKKPRLLIREFIFVFHFTPFLVSPKGAMICSFPSGGRLGRG
jgi:hypothetical protein